MSIVNENVKIGEEIHIWEDMNLLFEGIYKNDNPYAYCEVVAIGTDTDVETWKDWLSLCVRVMNV